MVTSWATLRWSRRHCILCLFDPTERQIIKMRLSKISRKLLNIQYILRRILQQIFPYARILNCINSSVGLRYESGLRKLFRPVSLTLKFLFWNLIDREKSNIARNIFPMRISNAKNNSQKPKSCTSAKPRCID